MIIKYHKVKFLKKVLKLKITLQLSDKEFFTMFLLPKKLNSELEKGDPC